MREVIERRTKLLVDNQSVMSKGFFLEHSLTNAVVAAAFADRDLEADVDLIKNSRKLLKSKQGIFSDFRSYNELIVSARMAMSSSPEEYLDQVIDVYKKFQKGKIFGSSYRVLAAMSICDQGRYADDERLIEKTNEILK